MEGEEVWAGSALAGLAELEHALRCAICKRLMRAACSLKGCGHAFCSLCVRRALAAKGECPQCRAHSSTAAVLPNKALDAAVRHYEMVRPALLTVKSSAGISLSTDLRDSSLIKSSKNSSSAGVAIVGKKRIANAVYHVMKDKQLKDEVAKHGLPTHGPRKALVKRLKEYILQFNSLVDGEAPITKEDLERIRQEVLAKENLLAREQLYSSSSSRSAPKGKLPPVNVTEDMKKGFAQLWKQIVKRENRKRKNKWRLESASSSSSSSEQKRKKRKRKTPEKKSLSPWRKIRLVARGVDVHFNENTNEVIFIEDEAMKADLSPTQGSNTTQKQTPTRVEMSDVIEIDSNSRESISNVATRSKRPKNSTWACQYCTFINTNTLALCCEVCKKLREKPVTQLKQSTLKSF